MWCRKALSALCALLLPLILVAQVHALDFQFDFSGDCDDCAFDGSPLDDDFNPFNDGLTETVTGSLSLTGLSIDEDGFIDFLGAGSVVFSYDGSSLLNPFTINDPFLFTNGLLPSGDIGEGLTFTLSSSQNITDPENPLSFQFPNFCTDIGELVLGDDICAGAGLVSFALDDGGNWNISGDFAFDIGGNGQLTPASSVPEPGTIALFALGIAGIGVARKRNGFKS